MRIGLVYINAANLGDIIIHETTKYMVEDILKRKGIQAEIIDVAIGSYKPQEKIGTKAGTQSIFHRLINKTYRLAQGRPVFFHLFPKSAGRILVNTWSQTSRARHYMENEKNKLKNVDLIVFCGGGLIKFQRQEFPYYLNDITSVADQLGIPVAFSATGVEGYDPKDIRCRILKTAVNRECVKFISTRDDYDTLINCYSENPNTIRKKSCDPAFWVKETYNVSWKGKDSGIVGLNVIRPSIFKEYLGDNENKDLIEIYRNIIEYLFLVGLRVEMFSNGLSADNHFIELFQERYPSIAKDDRFTTYEPQTEIDLIERISKYERLLAVRLHAGIIGTALGIPNVSLVWNRKQTLFGEQTGLAENFIQKESFDARFICNKLLNAKSYISDKRYKKTVYQNLEEILCNYGRIQRS